MIPMKHKYLYLGLISALAVSCSVEELVDPNEMAPAFDSFYAYTEARSDDADSRAYIDAEDGHSIHWNKGDRISVFSKKTVGLEYSFKGEDGDTEGAFAKVEGESSSEQGEAMPAIYAVYPHSGETTAQSDGTILFNLPATQTYLRNDSFGKDANIMVAKTDNDVLLFKNAVGYLTFRLYGNRSMSISSITLEGNKGEILAGPGSIDFSGDAPVLSMAGGEDAVKELRLFCKDVVELGTSNQNCKEFWLVLPPMTFSKGFTITVATSDGGVFTKSTSSELTIERNMVRRMAPLQVSASANSNLKITSLTKVYGKYRKKTTSSHWPYTTTTTIEDKSYTAEPSSDGLTYTFTIPTYTDFHSFVMEFDIPDNTTLRADDKVIVRGETPFDASQPVALAVCNGDRERRYTLIVRNTGLPVVKITTTGEGFTLDKLESYQNSLQSSDDKDHRIWLPVEPDDEENSSEYHADWSASVSIYNSDGSAGIEGTTVGTQIKGRGNYTWTWDKKPYAFKFAEAKSVLGMPAHKRWVVLANWRDRTLLRNDAAFWLSERSGLAYTPRGRFVELEFNGEHRGNYYLCEQIKVDENRVNITEIKPKQDHTGGFLMEIDSYWDELNKFKSAEFNLKYMFKEPDKDKVKKPEFKPAYEFMENYINDFERSLMTESCVASKDYENYLDPDSAIMFMLLNELTGNRDFFQNGDDTVYGPHSTYLYKDTDAKGGKLFMGPIWDFDYETFVAQSKIVDNSDNRNGWRGFTKTGYYYHYLCYNQDFVDRIVCLWNDKKEAFKLLTGHIEEMAGKIGLSQQYDEALWPYKTSQKNRNDNGDYYENGKVVPYETAISRMKTYFLARVGWISDQLGTVDNPVLTRTSPSFKYTTPEDWVEVEQ